MSNSAAYSLPQTPAELAVVQAFPILYVDDEAFNLEVFEAAFGDHFTVRLADSASAALEILAREDIAIVVTDNRMPGRLGIDLLVEVHARYPTVRRVLCTAYSDQQTAIDAINRAAVEHYLVKPWQPDHVTRLLHNLIASSNLQRTAVSLRRGLVQREREAAVSALRRRVEHDLGNVISVLHGVEFGLNEIWPSHGGMRREVAHSEVEELLSDLSGAVKRLSELHQASRESVQPAAMEPVDLDAEELLDTVSRLAVEDLHGRGTVTVTPCRGIDLWIDRLGLIKVMLRAISWLVRADDAHANIRLNAVNLGRSVRIELLAEPGVDGGRVDAALDGSLAFVSGPESDLAVARELAYAIGGDLFAFRGGVAVVLPQNAT